MKSVDYSKLTAVLIEAVKELNNQNAALQKKNVDSENRFDALNKTVEEMQANMLRMKNALKLSLLRGKKQDERYTGVKK